MRRTATVVVLSGQLREVGRHPRARWPRARSRCSPKADRSWGVRLAGRVGPASHSCSAAAKACMTLAASVVR
ncbi:hypothetical protein [Ornithinimicrobium kibberense]|uniref:hypothetical protein n=1 Tax=Ornithinimicrobium kibberense TaxID=282060 RepID=UPI003613C67D